ncbi:hypothetical protein WJX74_000155 [Apatococcus lobatus]|uniref:Uncharacterized protein n=1 Tax=Apatococcus lobatus TaxID=904363 RepID=A0AAW1QAG8_9CHLO
MVRTWAADYWLGEIRQPLEQHCLLHLSPAQLLTLGSTPRALHEVVEDHYHVAWARVGAEALPATAQPSETWTTGQWLAAFRQLGSGQQPSGKRSMGAGDMWIVYAAPQQKTATFPHYGRPEDSHQQGLLGKKCWHEKAIQQPVRTASLKQVVRMEPGAERIASVPGLKHHHNHSYFLSSDTAGVVTLYDADCMSGRSSQLELQPDFHHWTPFVTRMGRLGTVEACRDHPHELTCWTIDVITGLKTPLPISQKLYCFWSDWHHSVVHFAAGLILGMPNPQTIVILDAETVQQVSRIDPRPVHHEDIEGEIIIGTMAWSVRGDMLAVSMSLITPPPGLFVDGSNQPAATLIVHSESMYHRQTQQITLGAASRPLAMLCLPCINTLT